MELSVAERERLEKKLDLLDVKEGIEEFNDSIRWVPTDHMLVDCMTKAMHPALMLDFLPGLLGRSYRMARRGLRP